MPPKKGGRGRGSGKEKGRGRSRGGGGATSDGRAAKQTKRSASAGHGKGRDNPLKQACRNMISKMREGDWKTLRANLDSFPGKELRVGTACSGSDVQRFTWEPNYHTFSPG